MILVIDNYDSFTYNLVQILGSLGQRVMVRRNDALTPAQARSLSPRAIIISPGPGRPEKAGICCALIEKLAGRVPILGVCLGHQAIALAMGARVERAALPVHGKPWDIYHHGRGIYAGLRNPFRATRYHSLLVAEQSIPANLLVSAFTASGEVMGVCNQEMGLEGVQFHPESIATPQGVRVIRNFLDQLPAGKRRESGGA